jgi:hypothetical protein
MARASLPPAVLQPLATDGLAVTSSSAAVLRATAVALGSPRRTKVDRRSGSPTAASADRVA